MKSVIQEQDKSFAIPMGHIVLYLSKSPLEGYIVIEVFDNGNLCAINQVPVGELRQILAHIELI